MSLLKYGIDAYKIFKNEHFLNKFSFIFFCEILFAKFFDTSKCFREFMLGLVDFREGA